VSVAIVSSVGARRVDAAMSGHVFRRVLIVVGRQRAWLRQYKKELSRLRSWLVPTAKCEMQSLSIIYWIILVPNRRV
jgi:hypothetical protein